MTEQQTITRGLKMLATAEIIAAGMSLVAALDLFSIIELGLAGISAVAGRDLDEHRGLSGDVGGAAAAGGVGP